MKRFAAILLSLYVLAVSVKETPSLLIFQLKRSTIQKEIKQKIKNGIPKTELTPFTLTQLQNAKWEKPGKEFWLNQQIYDVIRLEKEHENILIWCFKDVKEKGLFAELNQLLDNAYQDLTIEFNEEEPLLQLYVENEKELPKVNDLPELLAIYRNAASTQVYLPFPSPPPEELNFNS